MVPASLEDTPLPQEDSEAKEPDTLDLQLASEDLLHLVDMLTDLHLVSEDLLLQPGTPDHRLDSEDLLPQLDTLAHRLDSEDLLLLLDMLDHHLVVFLLVL